MQKESIKKSVRIKRPMNAVKETTLSFLEKKFDLSREEINQIITKIGSEQANTEEELKAYIIRSLQFQSLSFPSGFLKRYAL